jgi:hypothetical protein
MEGRASEVGAHKKVQGTVGTVDNIDQASARGEPASVLPVATKQEYVRAEEPSWEMKYVVGGAERGCQPNRR